MFRFLAFMFELIFWNDLGDKFPTLNLLLELNSLS